MKDPREIFDRSHAESYDERWRKLAPMREALHFLTRVAFRELTESSHLLCVGAGTGAEAIALAEAFPAWTLTVVEPSKAMMDVCRKNTENAGISPRCRFHEGYVDTLPAERSFDAATAFLVSQFLVEKERRRDFFREIGRRLRPGAPLINADLASPRPAPFPETLLDLWTQSLLFAGIPREAALMATSRWGKDVSVLAPAEIGALLGESGFEDPTLFHQALFIHAWISKAPRT